MQVWWKDDTSYSKGKRGVEEPKIWTAILPNYSISKISVHKRIHMGDTWFLTCEDLDYVMYDLDTNDHLVAKEKALILLISLIEEKTKQMDELKQAFKESVVGLNCQSVVVGGVYQHSKTGGVYYVLGISVPSDLTEPQKFIKAINTETEKYELCIETPTGFIHSKDLCADTLVLYHRVEPSKCTVKIWARPKGMFENTMLLDGEIVPRFKLLYPTPMKGAK
jgi:hypothetical protein